MAFISYLGPEASPELQELYTRYGGAEAIVDNILRIHSHNPPSWDAHYTLYRTLMRGKGDLSAAQREMIAVVVSRLNGCHY